MAAAAALTLTLTVAARSAASIRPMPSPSLSFHSSSRHSSSSAFTAKPGCSSPTTLTALSSSAPCSVARDRLARSLHPPSHDNALATSTSPLRLLLLGSRATRSLSSSSSFASRSSPLPCLGVAPAISTPGTAVHAIAAVAATDKQDPSTLASWLDAARWISRARFSASTSTPSTLLLRSSQPSMDLADASLVQSSGRPVPNDPTPNRPTMASSQRPPPNFIPNDSNEQRQQQQQQRPPVVPPLPSFDSPTPAQYLIMVLAVVVLAVINRMVEDRSLKQITWQEFVTDYLAKGNVDQLLVRTGFGTSVYVHVKPHQSKAAHNRGELDHVEEPQQQLASSHRTPSRPSQHQLQQQPPSAPPTHPTEIFYTYDSDEAHSGGGDSTAARSADNAEPAPQSSWDRVRSAHPTKFGAEGAEPVHFRSTTPPVAYFTVADVESFERKLAESQDSLRFGSADRVKVLYHDSKTEVMYEIAYGVVTVAALWSLNQLVRRAFLASSLQAPTAGAAARARTSQQSAESGSKEAHKQQEQHGQKQQEPEQSSESSGSFGPFGNMFGLPPGMSKKTFKVIPPNDSAQRVTFADVAGLSEVKVEVTEFVDMLSKPDRFRALGAKVPRGLMLTGPPGTGKTLIAKAIAGESGVNFISAAGTDFVEMVVGVGPARVRDLFATAKANKPCVIYIDEIDAIGKTRSSAKRPMGGNSERENTLNQLLVQMDGFNPLEDVLVLASTNRVDVLDPALLRPGRFDRQVHVGLPDMRERREILHVHMQRLKLDMPMEQYSERIAQLTPGLSGAHLANICNEAALHAGRHLKPAVTMADFDHAIDRTIAGYAKTTRVVAPNERLQVAYHEAGHAIVGWMLEHTDPFLKVSIVPHSSRALGYSQYLPSDRYIRSKEEQLFDRMCLALGGRAADHLVYNHFTTGAQDDLQRVTRMAYEQISTLGMGTTMPGLSFRLPSKSQLSRRRYSNALAEEVDAEVRALVTRAEKRATMLLVEHRAKLDELARVLNDREVVDYETAVQILGPRPFGNGLSKEQIDAATRPSTTSNSAPKNPPTAPNTPIDPSVLHTSSSHKDKL
ncbi:Rca1p [Capsaspora owczarzaki ATCC 30864]|uniref:Rca1p n=1 Tax=Capsaspora owczarzaki (strain ATCC 30864) TaxID=595528 RepID=A0A0D2X4L8_CAPO3|nr:Rca1p [Capsaspora owczarzaki ATCC 30864]